jgi:preprotein translocase subunit SecE
MSPRGLFKIDRMTTNETAKANIFVRLWRYLRESKEELEKVSWPSKKDTFRYSLIVIALSIILAAFFAGFDYLLNLGLEKLIEIKS